MFRISPYKCNIYRQCPLAYKFEYVDFLGREYKTPKPYLTMGAHVHNALKDFYEKLKPEERSYKKLESLLRIRWRENRKGFEDREEEQKYGIEAMQMLRLFSHKMDVKKNPLMLEDYYDADINDRITLLGRIDRVDQDAHGLHIIDYKTGKLPENDESWKFQLLAYSYIVTKNTHLSVRKASCLYLKNYEWLSLRPNDVEYRSMIESIVKQVSIIQSDRVFEPRQGKHCKYCDYASICTKKDNTVV